MCAVFHHIFAVRVRSPRLLSGRTLLVTHSAITPRSAKLNENTLDYSQTCPGCSLNMSKDVKLIKLYVHHTFAVSVAVRRQRHDVAGFTESAVGLGAVGTRCWNMLRKVR